MLFKKVLIHSKNVLISIVSLSIAVGGTEVYMRSSIRFQHGGDTNPRLNITFERPPGYKRVVVIGDSLTYGDGVKSVEAYPYRLKEKLLNHRYGNYQVLNLGIKGINIDEEFQILTRSNPYFGSSAFSFDPDVIILTFCVNDIEVMRKPRPESKILPSGIHDFFLGNSLFYKFVHIKINQLLSGIGIQQSYPDFLKSIYSSNSEEWMLFNNYLNRFIYDVKRRNIKILLVIFPSMESLDDSHPYLDLYSKVIDIGIRNDAEVLNLFPYFKGRDARSLRVSDLNGHPNKEAYEIPAEAIYKTLIEKFDL